MHGIDVSPPSKETFYGGEIYASDLDLRELQRAAKGRLATHHACYIRRFPTDATVFVQFLSFFGAPLENYAMKGPSSITSSGLAPLHPVVNQVRYRGDDGNNFVYAKGGPLRPHSARSWSLVRPRFFSMLMIDPGWEVPEYGQNGESIVVRWRDVLADLKQQCDAQLAKDLALLSRTRIKFSADHVHELVSDLPLLYQLADPADDLDLGVRLKSDMVAKLSTIRTTIQNYEEYLAAVSRFWDTASEPHLRATYQMMRGDLVILDNNRFGHGRLSFTRQRSNHGINEFNPREIWSVTLR